VRRSTIRGVDRDDIVSRLQRAEPPGVSIEPLDDWLLLEPLDDDAETPHGLIIPASSESACRSAVVVATGDDVVGVVAGDKVLYPRDAGFELRLGGQAKRLVQRRHVIARIAD
jgi:co-chaperonin GroES (HSP10)